MAIILNSADIKSMLSYDKCIDLMRTAMLATSKRETELPMRWAMPLPNGIMGIMPGGLTEQGQHGIKVINILPSNSGTDRSSHIGALLYFDSVTGDLLSMLDAGEVTAIRTACASAMATDLLANKDVQTLTIIGAGEQAYTHFKAMNCVRNFTDVRIATRNSDKALAFIETLKNDTDTNTEDMNFQHTTSVQDAISGADVVCTVTSASTPLLKGEWIEPGMHLNVVGSSSKEKKEIDTAAVLKGRIYIDYLPSTLNQAGEIIDAIEEGAFSADKIVGEIGQLLAGTIAGRSSTDDITIYRSLGVLSQDLVVAQYLYEQATRENLGTHVVF